MASPHAAGVAALIKQIHPDYTADQVIALMKKQANENFDRLAEPTDGKEYRGAGLVNALAAVLKDQPRPVLGSIEYSYDGATDWRPLADAHLAGTIYVRATVSGPVTKATLTVMNQEPVTGEGTGAFTGNGITLIAGPYDTATFDMTDPFSSVTLSAEGRNKDERADDDVTDAVHFHVDDSAHEGGSWVNDAAGWKYCYEDSTCAKNRPVTIGEDTYYFDANGLMVTGWASYNGAWHWMGASGRAATGWVNDRGTWYLLDDSGMMVTGWAQVGDRWYYLASSGAMTTGWASINGAWYYLDASGAMVTGWVNVNGTWYYLTSTGEMARGWVNDGGTWYYLHASGAMATGRTLIDGTWYSFARSGAWLG